MNTALFHQIADSIEENPEMFNQDVFNEVYGKGRHQCETPCCVAGHAVILSDHQIDEQEPLANYARKCLGIQMSGWLFFPTWPLSVLPKDLRGQVADHQRREIATFHPNAKQAAFVLRQLADQKIPFSFHPNARLRKEHHWYED